MCLCLPVEVEEMIGVPQHRTVVGLADMDSYAGFGSSFWAEVEDVCQLPH